MRGLLLFAMIIPALVGCRTHMFLRENTLKTTATLADLNYEQVLNNVARFTACPSTLPLIAVINDGTITVDDKKGLDAFGQYSPTLAFAQQLGNGTNILNLVLNPSVSRGLTEKWTVTPVTDIDSLRRLRCAFQMLVLPNERAADACCDSCQQMKEFFLADEHRMECLIPQGWYDVGCEKQVPGNACYVGCYGNTYVWVMPQGMEGLARFTMTVLELATRKPEVPIETVVRKYKSDGTLEGVEVTMTQVNQEAVGKMKNDRNRSSPETQ